MDSLRHRRPVAGYTALGAPPESKYHSPRMVGTQDVFETGQPVLYAWINFLLGLVCALLAVAAFILTVVSSSWPPAANLSLPVMGTVRMHAAAYPMYILSVKTPLSTLNLGYAVAAVFLVFALFFFVCTLNALYVQSSTVTGLGGFFVSLSYYQYLGNGIHPQRTLQNAAFLSVTALVVAQCLGLGSLETLFPVFFVTWGAAIMLGVAEYLLYNHRDLRRKAADGDPESYLSTLNRVMGVNFMLLGFTLLLAPWIAFFVNLGVLAGNAAATATVVPPYLYALVIVMFVLTVLLYLPLLAVAFVVPDTGLIPVHLELYNHAHSMSYSVALALIVFVGVLRLDGLDALEGWKGLVGY